MVAHGCNRGSNMENLKRKRKRKKWKPWCWYCDRKFLTERILRLHQRRKHFRCNFYWRDEKQFNCGPELADHVLEVHGETLSEIPNASKSKNRPDIYIVGSSGIPADSWNSIGKSTSSSPVIPGIYVANDDLSSLFECKNCSTYVLPPILQCQKGHLVCSTCHNQSGSCSICNELKGNAANIFMNKIAGTVSFSCKYRSAGCKEQLMLEEKKNHEECCQFRQGPSDRVHNDQPPPVVLPPRSYSILTNNLEMESKDQGHQIPSKDDLASLFKCTACFNYTVTDILQCKNGHFFCTTCHEKLENCPSCQEVLKEAESIRNSTAEKFASSMFFPCKYSVSGCKQRLMLDGKTDHEELCEFSIKTLEEEDTSEPSSPRDTFMPSSSRSTSVPFPPLNTSVPMQQPFVPSSELFPTTNTSTTSPFNSNIQRNVLEIPGAVMTITNQLKIVHPDVDLSLEELRDQAGWWSVPASNATPNGSMHSSMTAPTMMNAAMPAPYALPYMYGTPNLSLPYSYGFPFSSSAAGGFSSIPYQYPVAQNFVPFTPNFSAVGTHLPLSSQIPYAGNFMYSSS